MGIPQPLESSSCRFTLTPHFPSFPLIPQFSFKTPPAKSSPAAPPPPPKVSCVEMLDSAFTLWPHVLIVHSWPLSWPHRGGLGLRSAAWSIEKRGRQVGLNPETPGGDRAKKLCGYANNS